MSNSAKSYVDDLIANLKSGSIQKRPDGCLQGANLNMGIVTEVAEVEGAIMARDPRRAAAEVERFRAALAGNDEAPPTAEPVPNPPPPKPDEPTLAERTLAAMRKLTDEVNFRLSGN